jgi:hypothetical protein
MRPIDADALIQNYCGACANKEFCAEESCQYYEIRRRIETAPTIEPEVRHGRWIDKGDYAVCTECGGESGTQYDGVEPIPLMTQFCPHCGAKMNGGADNG